MAIVKLPGLVDPHVHLRDPGATHKEDFSTGTRAALAGGFTTVLDMPNNFGDPVISPAALGRKLQTAESRLFCDVGFFYGATPGNMDSYAAVLGMVVGLKLYLDHTTGDLKVEELEDIKNVMLAWPAHKPLCVHAEDRTLAMVLGLLPLVNRSVHFCHISERVEIELIRDAKGRGMPVTCEVAPHHLYLTEGDLPRLGSHGVMKPPLKKGRDVDALWANIDIIDVIATDHAPHTRDEKGSANPPFGVPGLESSLPLMLTAVNNGRLSLDRLIEMMHTAPMRLFHLSAQPETYITVDTQRRWLFSAEGRQTRCEWTPFEGMPVVGAVEQVVLRGVEVVRSGQVTNETPLGGFTRPVA